MSPPADSHAGIRLGRQRVPPLRFTARPRVHRVVRAPIAALRYFQTPSPPTDPKSVKAYRIQGPCMYPTSQTTLASSATRPPPALAGRRPASRCGCARGGSISAAGQRRYLPRPPLRMQQIEVRRSHPGGRHQQLVEATLAAAGVGNSSAPRTCVGLHSSMVSPPWAWTTAWSALPRR